MIRFQCIGPALALVLPVPISNVSLFLLCNGHLLMKFQIKNIKKLKNISYTNSSVENTILTHIDVFKRFLGKVANVMSGRSTKLSNDQIQNENDSRHSQRRAHMTTFAIMVVGLRIRFHLDYRGYRTDDSIAKFRCQRQASCLADCQ